MSDIENNRWIKLAKLYENYLKSEIDYTISDSETMWNQWYKSVGESAAHVIYSACVTSWVHVVTSVLDVPCGHGRVLRHLVKLFPDAEFDVCDLDKEGVNFCAKQFGARPLFSKEDFLKVHFDRQYNLIWVGSLFTHLNKENTFKWLAHLAESLTPDGIIIATFHGRYSEKKGAEFGYIEKLRWKKILSDYKTSGYGYSDYPVDNSHDYIEGSYGVSLSNPSAVIAEVVKIPGVRVFSYVERGWSGHQDVLVVGKPDLME